MKTPDTDGGTSQMVGSITDLADRVRELLRIRNLTLACSCGEPFVDATLDYDTLERKGRLLRIQPFLHCRSCGDNVGLRHFHLPLPLQPWINAEA